MFCDNSYVVSIWGWQRCVYKWTKHVAVYYFYTNRILKRKCNPHIPDDIALINIFAWTIGQNRGGMVVRWFAQKVLGSQIGALVCEGLFVFVFTAPAWTQDTLASPWRCLIFTRECKCKPTCLSWLWHKRMTVPRTHTVTCTGSILPLFCDSRDRLHRPPLTTVCLSAL